MHAWSPSPTLPDRRPGFAVAGGLLGLVAVVAMLLGITKHRDLREFSAAPVCVAPVPSDATATCRFTVRATVEGVEIKSGKISRYAIRLSGPADVTGAYRFPDENTFLDRVRVGDDVTVEIWLGKVVAVDADGERTLTSAAPLFGYRKVVSVGVATALMAVVMFLVYGWRVSSAGYRSLRTTLTGWQAAVYTTVVAVALSALVTAIGEVAGTDAPLRWILLATFAMIGPTAAIAYAVSVIRARPRPTQLR